MWVTVDATNRLKMKATMYLSLENVVTKIAVRRGVSVQPRRAHAASARVQPTVEDAKHRETPANSPKSCFVMKVLCDEDRKRSYSITTSYPCSVNWMTT
jgi:hypothetical protein